MSINISALKDEGREAAVVGCVCECLYFSSLLDDRSLSDLQTDWVIPGTTSQNRSYKGRAQPVMSSDPPLRPREGRGSRLNQKIQFPRALARMCLFDRRSVYERCSVQSGGGRERGKGRERKEGGGASPIAEGATSPSVGQGRSRFLFPPPAKGTPRRAGFNLSCESCASSQLENFL